MEVKRLALGQRAGQCLLHSMTSPVYVTIKPLKFHKLEASLCHAEKHATSAERPLFLVNMKENPNCLVVIPTNPSVTATGERWWEECLCCVSGNRWWWIATNCSVWQPLEGRPKSCLASPRLAVSWNGRIDWRSKKKFFSTLLWTISCEKLIAVGQRE